MQRPATLRRIAKRAILCLLLGAVLQYFVAIAFALDKRPPTDVAEWVARSDLESPEPNRMPTPLYFHFSHDARRDKIVVNLWNVSLANQPLIRDWSNANWLEVVGPKQVFHEAGIGPAVPRWSRFQQLALHWNLGDFPMSPLENGVEVACGWPRRSASYFATWSRGSEVNVVDGLVLERSFDHWSSLPRVIPLAIYWPGAIINTLIYASLLFIPLSLVSWIASSTRCRFRRRAGRCTTCGYDLRGAPHPICPECGAAHDRAHRSTP